MVHAITKSNKKDLRDMSVVYQSLDNRIYIFEEGGAWKNWSCDEGVHKIIDTLVEIYLEAYETYLIRKIESTSGVEQVSMIIALEEYYRFITCFKIPSCVVNKNDTQILYNEDDDAYVVDVDKNDISQHVLVDKYSNIYLRIAGELTAAKKRIVTRHILSEVKSTTKTNMKELNKSVMDIIKVDPQFQMHILTAR